MGMGDIRHKDPFPGEREGELKMWEMDDRVGIQIRLNDEPGTLMSCLQTLKENGINLTAIQSKPPKMVHGKS